MSSIRYLIDEDTTHAIRDGLLRRQPNIEIQVIGGYLAPLLGTKDPEILNWTEREEYILISSNRRTMPRHLRDYLKAGGHTPGIFLLRRKATLRDIIEDLLLVWEAGAPQEYQDKITYIPL
ncbi:MAG: DUF5615 family PIN-like protein [Deltaproteobacteria bacterium]|nr:DUF5615 family PIN-like protein [Deltaproteobacteria bacterium]